MPGFASTFQENPDAIWQMVHFIKDTGERRRRDLPPEDFAQQESTGGAEKDQDVESKDAA
jgi:hypothetical protein